jgi:uncharacterized protein
MDNSAAASPGHHHTFANRGPVEVTPCWEIRIETMKKLSHVLSLLSAALLSSLELRSAETFSGAAGHWEGAITLPTMALSIRVDLSQPTDSWQGTIDIPAQGLRGFKLEPVKVEGEAVSFAMPGIPGNPQFTGRVGDDARSISGNFSQGGGRFPFKLERTAAPVAGGEPSRSSAQGKGVEGYWSGVIKVSATVELRTAIEITSANAEKPDGVLISLDQGNARIPISALSEHDGIVHVEAQRVGGVFDGKLNRDGSELAGEWKQGGGTMPLVLKRLAKPVSLTRPQDPKKPYPYSEEEVIVENKSAGLTLAGTLTLPAGPGLHPAVILLTGSGPQDRDEALMGHRPFFVLADYLTRHGVAVLRCDDRGFGKSTGNFAKAVDADFVEDALAQVAYLRTRKEIDPSHIGLVGHSEGGIVAPRAAVKSPDVAFIVLLAGVGLPMEELLLRQNRDISNAAGLGRDLVEQQVEAERKVFGILREEKDPVKAEAAIREIMAQTIATMSDEQRKTAGLSNAVIGGQIKMLLSPWFRDMLGYDPAPTLRMVKCPVLAIAGEKDLQVAAKDNLAAISDALKAGGNERIRTVELPGLNHLFQTCQTGTPTEYGRIEETFNPAALKLVSDWVHETIGKQKNGVKLCTLHSPARFRLA